MRVANGDLLCGRWRLFCRPERQRPMEPWRRVRAANRDSNRLQKCSSHRLSELSRPPYSWRSDACHCGGSTRGYASHRSCRSSRTPVQRPGRQRRLPVPNREPSAAKWKVCVSSAFILHQKESRTCHLRYHRKNENLQTDSRQDCHKERFQKRKSLCLKPPLLLHFCLRLRLHHARSASPSSALEPWADRWPGFSSNRLRRGLCFPMLSIAMWRARRWIGRLIL